MSAVMQSDKKMRGGIPQWFWLAATFAGAQLLFAAFPHVDIWVSSLFYSQEHGFWLNGEPRLQLLREVILYSSVLLFLAALVLWPASARDWFYTGAPPQIWGFIVALYLSGPVLIVNGVLKKFSGRARPAQIHEFGGTREFSPAFELADQCEKNCSFVSGEGSAAVVLFISVMVLLRHLPSKRYFPAIRVAAATLAVLGLFLRAAKGRHFLSDTVFAVLIMTALAYLIHQICFSRSLFRNGAPTPGPRPPAAPARGR